MILNIFREKSKTNAKYKRGFALPTVLAASVIMLTVLVASITLTVAMRISVKNQYYSKLMKTANQAGVEFAMSCGDDAIGITSNNPLNPGDDCSGKTDLECEQNPTTPGCYVAFDESNNLVSTFEVSKIDFGPNGEIINIDSEASVKLVRDSNQAKVIRSITAKGGYKSEYVTFPISWKQVSTGEYNTCAISADDQIYCWGSNGNKYLGDQSKLNSLVPIKTSSVASLAGKSFKAVSVGTYSTCALDFSGDVYCWGDIPDYGNLGKDPTKLITIRGVKSIEVGTELSCAINNDSKVYCWNSSEIEPNPTLVEGELVGKEAIEVSVGQSHACAITSDKKAICWGANYSGQIGNGVQDYQPTPVDISAKGDINGKEVTTISAGYSNTCAIAEGQAYCWGSNESGQLGIGTTGIISKVPKAVKTSGEFDGKTVLSISVGSGFVCAVASDNKAYCWGVNAAGQLGTGDKIKKTEPHPVDDSGVLNNLSIKAITVGTANSCAIDMNSQIFCWGNNLNGTIGNGTIGEGAFSGSLVPLATAKSSVTMDKKLSYFASGGDNTVCVVDVDKKGYCWGEGSPRGFITNNPAGASRVPAMVSMIGSTILNTTLNSEKIVDFSVSLGGKFGCLIAANDDSDLGNKIYCWGNNNLGQLAEDTKTIFGFEEETITWTDIVVLKILLTDLIFDMG